MSSNNVFFSYIVLVIYCKKIQVSEFMGFITIGRCVHLCLLTAKVEGIHSGLYDSYDITRVRLRSLHTSHVYVTLLM